MTEFERSFEHENTEEKSGQRDRARALVFAMSLASLRRVAREKGYALAVHGSMSRDFDLIACPWTEDAVSAAELAEVIRDAVDGHYRMAEGLPLPEPNPASKPHGRLAWAIYINKTNDGTSYGPYIDLSVMPRESDSILTSESQE